MPVAALTAPADYVSLQAAALPSAVAFFFLALTAFALTGLRVWRRSGAAGEAAPSPDRGWVGVMLGVVAGLLLLTVGASLLLSLDLLALVVGTVLRPILTVLAILVLTSLSRSPTSSPGWPSCCARRWPAAAQRGNEPLGGLQGMLDQLRERGRPVEPSPELVLTSQWALLLFGAVVLALAIARALRWWRSREAEDEADEVRESGLALGARPGARCAAGWPRCSGGAPGPGRANRTGRPWPRSTPPPGATGLREMYRHLLALGPRAADPAGRRRRPSEHLPALRAALEPGRGPGRADRGLRRRAVRPGRPEPGPGRGRPASLAAE